MDYSSWEMKAAAALEEELSRSRPSEQLSKRLHELQTVLPDAEFEQRWMAICAEARESDKRTDAEFRALAAGRAAEQRPADLVTRSTTIDTTFSASGPIPYTLQWTNIPGGTGSDGAASVDINAGKFYASRSRNDNGMVDAYAAIGVGITPEVASCRLWIRPYVNWRGYEMFGRQIVHPGGPSESLYVRAEVELGIIVQSTTLSGGDFRTDAQTFPDLWQSAYTGPVNHQVFHSGTAFVQAYQLWVPASNTRRYSVWIVCRAIAVGTIGQNIRAYAVASTECTMPWLMVGQVY